MGLALGASFTCLSQKGLPPKKHKEGSASGLKALRPLVKTKADWLKIKGLTTTFAESFLALANSRSVNDNYVILKKFMEGLLKTDIPSMLSSSRQNLPWINTELKRQIRRKGRRFSKAIKSGLKKDWDNFIAIEKYVKHNLKKAESNFLETILRTGLEVC